MGKGGKTETFNAQHLTPNVELLDGDSCNSSLQKGRFLFWRWRGLGFEGHGGGGGEEGDAVAFCGRGGTAIAEVGAEGAKYSATI